MSSRTMHSDAEWRQHLNDMAEWYLIERLEYADIAQRLAGKGFYASPGTVKGKLQAWRVLRTNNDFVTMAQCFIHHKSHDRAVTFKRFGKEVPNSDIVAFMNQNSPMEGSSSSLPEHIQVVLHDNVCESEPTHQAADVSDSHSFPVLAQKSSKRVRYDLPTRKRKQAVDASPSDYAMPAPVGRTLETPEEPASDEDEQDKAEGVNDESSSHNKSREREMERAFAMLQKLGSKDAEATKAVEHARQLLSAAMKDDAETKRLKDRTDLGPLHSAGLRGDQETAKLLLEFNADINSKGGTGVTTLHCATAKGHYKFAEFLLQQPGIDINATTSNGMTALILATHQPYRHCAILLLENNAEVHHVDDLGRSALHYACLEPGMERIVQMIADRDTNINRQDKNGVTALHLALGNDFDEYVKPLLNRQASLNIPDKHGRTPFLQACFEGSTQTLLQLLQADADLTIRGNMGETALHILCQNGRDEVVSHLLHTRPEVDINARSHRSVTPLMLAVLGGHLKIVVALLDKNADLSIRDIDSDTALIMAIDRGYIEIAHLLIRKGSPPNPVGHSMLKWRLHVQNEHKTERELSALKPRKSPKFPRTEQTIHLDNNISKRNDDNSLQQVWQRKTQELIKLATEMSGMHGVRQNASIATPKGSDNHLTADFPAMNAFDPFLPNAYTQGYDLGYDYNMTEDL